MAKEKLKRQPAEGRDPAVRLDQGDLEEAQVSQPITRRESVDEPLPVPQGSQLERSVPIAAYKEAIRMGDFERAQQALELAVQEQDALQSFKKDLRPEALAVDRLRAFQERRQGQTPSNQLSKFPVLGGEDRSPFDLQGLVEGKRQSAFESVNKNRRADQQDLRLTNRQKFEMAHMLNQTELKVDEFTRTQNKLDQAAIQGDITLLQKNINSLLDNAKILKESGDKVGASELTRLALQTNRKLQEFIDAMSGKSKKR